MQTIKFQIRCFNLIYRSCIFQLLVTLLFHVANSQTECLIIIMQDKFRRGIRAYDVPSLFELWVPCSIRMDNSPSYNIVL